MFIIGKWRVSIVVNSHCFCYVLVPPNRQHNAMQRNVNSGLRHVQWWLSIRRKINRIVVLCTAVLPNHVHTGMSNSYKWTKACCFGYTLRFRFYVCILCFYSAPVLERSIAISLSVCLSVCACLSASISLEPLDRSSRIFCADLLWQWLGPPLAALQYIMYFRFYGWRLHVWP